MSKGPGRIESAIVELLKNTKDRALSISDITCNAFGLNGAEPTRNKGKADLELVEARILE